MRLSIWFGLLFLGLGILLSSLADALIDIPAMGYFETTAVFISAVLFVLFSAAMIGCGAALIIHWIIGFVGHSHFKGFVLEMILSFALFFVGIGAAVMTRSLWTGLHIFASFFAASAFLFNLSFINFFGSFVHGFTATSHFVSKKIKKWQNR